MMIRTNNPCQGTLDGMRCPYTARHGQTCNIHTTNLNYITKPKAPIVSWTIQYAHECDICTSKNNVQTYSCKQHRYCCECLPQAFEFPECPLCLSLKENASS